LLFIDLNHLNIFCVDQIVQFTENRYGYTVYDLPINFEYKISALLRLDASK